MIGCPKGNKTFHPTEKNIETGSNYSKSPQEVPEMARFISLPKNIEIVKAAERVELQRLSAQHPGRCRDS